MRQFVESLKRLYKNHSINQKKIEDLYDKGIINDTEKQYILTIE